MGQSSKTKRGSIKRRERKYHMCVAVSNKFPRKENSYSQVHFFDVHFNKGLAWYENCFRNISANDRHITGEVTPDILYLPWAVKVRCPEVCFESAINLIL